MSSKRARTVFTKNICHICIVQRKDERDGGCSYAETRSTPKNIKSPAKRSHLRTLQVPISQLPPVYLSLSAIDRDDVFCYGIDARAD
jgi:hypothetical protein